MNHVIVRPGNPVLIAGVLVVVAVLALWGVAWLAFDTSLAWALAVGWVFAAFLPFAIRLATIRLLPTDPTVFPH